MSTPTVLPCKQVIGFVNIFGDKTVHSTPICLLNKKRPHHKVRTGCDTCKKRRLKCDETKPECKRCLKADIKCEGYTSVPHTQLFTPVRTCITQPKSLGQSMSTFARNLDFPEDLEVLQLLHSQYAEFAHGSIGNETPTLHNPSYSLFRDQEEFSAHDHTIKWMSHYTSARLLPEFANSSFFTHTIPQVACAYDSLRHAIIACGFIGRSLLQKDPLPEYESANMKALEYANHAIQSLSSNKPPNIVFALCALVFWQIELVRGNIVTSTTHLMAADEIATHSREESPEAELTAVISEQLARGPREEVALTTKLAGLLQPEQSVSLRKKTTVRMMMRALPLVVRAMERTRTYCHVISDCERIIPALRRIHQELVWIIVRWGSDSLLTTWNKIEEANRVGKSLEYHLDLESKSFQLLVTTLGELDDYLINGHEFSIAHFRRQLAQEISSFLLITASNDLGMRQDFAEFKRIFRLLPNAEAVGVDLEATAGG